MLGLLTVGMLAPTAAAETPEVTVTINGNDGHLTAPGQGSIFAAVGKLVYIADPRDVFTPLALVKSAGQQEASQFPAAARLVTRQWHLSERY